MVLFKILQLFLLPSVFVPGLILVGFILLLKLKNKKIGKICLATGLILYYFFSITPIADLILAPLEKQYVSLNENDFNRAEKVVLLLGGGESSILRATEVLRIYAQKSQISNSKLQIIIAGRYLNLKINEGQRIKDFLVERGLPVEKIILENESINTFESAKNVTEILGQEPFFLVTSAYHMPRSMAVFKKMKANPIPDPTDFKIKKDGSLLNFFPDPDNLRKVNLALHEYFGILFYKFIK